MNKVSWTFIDQGVASFGNILVNIFPVQQLTLTDYGTPVLLKDGLYGLQIVNCRWFFTASVQAAVSRGDDYKELWDAALIMVSCGIKHSAANRVIIYKYNCLDRGR